MFRELKELIIEYEEISEELTEMDECWNSDDPYLQVENDPSDIFVRSNNLDDKVDEIIEWFKNFIDKDQNEYDLNTF